jgi:hypothetical protein
MSHPPSLVGTVLRIIVAGFLGGLAVFNAGYAGHVIFGWPERNIHSLPNATPFKQIIADQKVALGIYTIPAFPQNSAAEDRQAREKAFNEEYRQGPNAMIVIQPAGQDPMTGQTLANEFGTNVACCLLASWIVSLLAPTRSFATRLFVVVAMALFAWISVVVSYGIWYRFPLPFVLDELFNNLLEGTVAGLVIATIVRGSKAE